ncbi:MAG: hypothetical protein HEQ33_22695 [Dolichospermum sp. WA123]|nr:hypothetical protein [Dolichospermum sp. WA123]
MTEFSCLDCKHHIHYYNSPSMGEGEPELEFYCEHELVAEFEIEDESELVDIAENCDYFQYNITVEPIYLASINEQEIRRLGDITRYNQERIFARISYRKLFENSVLSDCQGCN